MKKRIGFLLALLAPAFVLTNTSANALVYQGLTNTSLGVATLNVASNVLTVGNIGSSGNDGVSIDLNGATGYTVLWEDLDPGNGLPVGAYVQGELIGTAGQVTNDVVGSLTVTKAGTTNYAVTANFPSSATNTFTVSVYLEGNLVTNLTGLSGTLCTASEMLHDEDDHGIWTWPGPPTKTNSTIFAFTGGPTVQGDALQVLPSDLSSVGCISSVQLLASSIPSINITNESTFLVYQGLTNAPLGNATLNVASNQLTVGNIGSSGQDGVGIDLNPGTSLETYWQDLDPGDVLPVGAYVQGTSVGTAGSVTNGVLGSVTITKAGTTNYVITADFSAIGVSNRTVQVYNEDTLVAQVTGQNGIQVATSTSFTFGISLECFPCRRVKDIILDSLTTVALNGGPTVTGDKLVIIPEGGIPPGTETGGQILMANIPSMTITQEQLSLVYQGLTNSRIASATLSVASNQLTLGNLGSSGNDGVSIAVAGATSYAILWQDLDPSNALPVGAYAQGQLIGTAGNVTNGMVGSLTVTKAGTANYPVTVNFPSSTTNTFTVSVYLQGTLVTNLTGLSGTLCTASEMLHDEDDHGIWTWPGPPTKTNSTIFAFTGGPTVQGDALQVLPSDLPSVGSISSVQLLASGIPQIVITNESASFASILKINSIARVGNNIVLSWTTEGASNFVQVTTNTTGRYNTNNFVDLAAFGISTPTLNFTDVGGATNKPGRYYRIREPLP